MSHTFYGYPVPSYPPRLYAQEPTLASNNDSDMMGFFSVRSMAGGRPSSSGYSMDSSYDHSDTSDDYGSPDDLPIPPHAETESYLRRTIGIPDPRPVSLWGVSDGRKLTTTEMARLAIWGSPEKKLTLAQIFQAVEARYPHMKDAEDKPWRRSIRHNLSLKDIFQKEERPNDHPGKGCYWILNVRHGEACSRRKDGSQGGGSEEEYGISPSPSAASSPQSHYAHLSQSPRQDLVSLHHEHRSSMGRYAEHANVPMDGRSHFSGSQNSAGAGYHQQPPHAINPRLTMGNYVDPRVGPSLQPLVPHHHHPHQHQHTPQHASLSMGPPSTASSGSSSSSRRPHDVLMSDSSSRRRTHETTFGFEDEDSKMRGFPKPRRTTD